MIAQVLILRELLVLPRGQSPPFTTTFLRARKRFNTKSQSNGGTGVSPVQAQAKACVYKNSFLTATRYKS